MSGVTQNDRTAPETDTSVVAAAYLTSSSPSAYGCRSEDRNTSGHGNCR